MAAFTSDGATLASGRNDGSVSLWDVRSRRRLARFKADASAINDVAFSPDGRLLATAGDDHRIRLWDLTTRRPVGTPLRSPGKPLHVAVSADGATVAAIADDAAVSSWNLRSDTRVVRRMLGGQKVFNTTGIDANDVAFDRDGRLIAASLEPDGPRLWRVGRHGLVGRPLEGRFQSATALMFSPDGETLLTRAGSTARLWNVRTRRPLAVPFAGAFEDGPVAISSDDTTLATIVSVDGGPQLLHVWSARDGRAIGTPLASHGGDHLDAAALSRNGVFAAGDEDGTLRLWNVRPRAPLGHALGDHGGWVRGLAFTAGGGTQR